MDWIRIRRDWEKKTQKSFEAKWGEKWLLVE
jgi:hypothetical protein